MQYIHLSYFKDAYFTEKQFILAVLTQQHMTII